MKRIEKLQQELKNTRRKVKRRNRTIAELKKSPKLAHDHVIKYISQTVKDKPLATFLETQIRIGHFKVKKPRYSLADKSLFLSIYNSSARTYRLLRKTLKLPSVATIKRITQSIKWEPGYHQNTLNHLGKLLGNKPLKDRTVVFTFDEVSLKERVAR